MGWILNQQNEICGWRWDAMYIHINQFLELLDGYCDKRDYGFFCAAGFPNNIKLCDKGTWNDRMGIETAFSVATIL